MSHAMTRFSSSRFVLRMGATLLMLILTMVVGAIACGVVVVTLGLPLLALVIDIETVRPIWSFFAVGICAIGMLCLILWGERHAPAHTVATTGARLMENTSITKIQPIARTVAQQMDTPVPALYIAPTDAPLSFSTGYRSSDSRLVISEGLLDLLEGAELRAVVAHEIAHVKNRDMMVMSVAALPIMAAGRVFKLLFGPTRGVDHGVPSRANYADALMAVGVLLSFPVAIVAYLLWISLSRAREFAADRAAVVSTGEPAALASALEQVDQELTRRPVADSRAADVAAFAIVNPTDHHSKGLLTQLLSTHPGVNARLDQLKSLERASET